MDGVGEPGPVEGDAFGQALLAHHRGGRPEIVVERDDGLVSLDSFDYFSPPEGPEWDWITQRLGRRILDIGCGAGRGCLALQDMGMDVVGLDVSPGAVEVCQDRGVRRTFVGTVQELAATEPEPFDSFVGLGNNLGLLASPAAAISFLAALEAMAHPGSALLGTMLDPYAGDDPIHGAYHETNRQAGRLGGEVLIRVRYLRLATPWFGLLWCSPAELAEVAGAAGWTVADVLPGGFYAAEVRPRGARGEGRDRG